MRKPIEIFANKMETKLQAKDDERGECGWLSSNCSVRFLFNRLKQEIIELDSAFGDCNPCNLEEECIDVANFAMMISDRIRGRKNSTK